MRTADYIWQRLAREVDTVFFVPGGGASHLVDALGQSGLRAVSCLHEQGAGYAALAYAQVHGFGVCLTTSGPGASNAITPCLAAWVDSVPMIFVSGQVMTRWLSHGQRSRGTQEGPTFAMVKPITKSAGISQDPVFIPALLEGLIATAKDTRPGPVWLDIPQDIQGMNIEPPDPFANMKKQDRKNVSQTA